MSVAINYQDALRIPNLSFSLVLLSHTHVQSVRVYIYIQIHSFFISLCYRCYLLCPACSLVLSLFSEASGVKRRRRLLVHRIPDNLRKLLHHDAFLLQVLDENRLVELGKLRDSGGHAEKKGIEISDPDSREMIYGMPYSEWKDKFQKCI